MSTSPLAGEVGRGVTHPDFRRILDLSTRVFAKPST
jgi:hypothetical protein